MGWPRGSEDSIGQEGPDVFFFDQRCIDAWKKKKNSLSCGGGVLVLIAMGCSVGFGFVCCIVGG